jgi:primosomal protein N'
MWILDVVPIKKGLPKDILSYFSPHNLADGTLVSVPLRSRTIQAVVVSSRDAREEKQSVKTGAFALRKISAEHSDRPIPNHLFETARIAGLYYRAPRGTMLDLIVSDFSFFIEEPASGIKRIARNEETQSERLLFQSPLDERISFYRTYIREAFAKKESVVCIVPTIADLSFMKESLSRGIADFVLVLHGELSKKKMTEATERLLTETHPLVVITTPTYASLMRPDVGTIILEHESSTAYNTPSLPSYDFRVLMEILARTAGIKYIVGDSLLRVETLGRKETGQFGAVAPITFRALAPIAIEIVQHGLPEALPTRLRNEQVPALGDAVRGVIDHIQTHKGKVFCFSLRTGLATFTRCRDCGKVVLCEYCGSALVLYSAGNGTRVFICNKCKRHRPSESRCSTCNSWNLAALGTGSAFVEEEIKRLYPELPVFRIDREATPTRTEAKKVADQFAAIGQGVLVGTEMALFYMHDIDDACIVSFDTLFNIPSYRTNERIIELFLAIAERTHGTLYVQTRDPDEPILRLVRSNNYSQWYRSELAERLEYNYPPYATIIKITWRGKETEKQAATDYLQDILSPFSPDIFEGQLIAKGRRETVVNAVIRPKQADWSYSELIEGRALSEHLRKILARLPDECIISINPDNLL